MFRETVVAVAYFSSTVAYGAGIAERTQQHQLEQLRVTGLHVVPPHRPGMPVPPFQQKPLNALAAHPLSATAAISVNVTTDALGAIFTYDAVGNRESAALPNGMVTLYTYDRRNRLTKLSTSRNGTLIHEYTYTLDPSGLRTRVDAIGADGASRVTTYAYDWAKRLTREVQSRNGIEEFRVEYSYDKSGNRIQTVANGVTTTYIYNVNDWLVSETASGGAVAGTVSYTHDENGNVVAKDGPLGHVGYVYDDANRLSEVRAEGETITYQYDPDGLMVEKVRVPANGAVTTWRFVWDVGRKTPQIIEELSADGDALLRPIAKYVFGDDLIALTRGEVTTYVVADGLGNTRALADAGGAITDTYAYDAWGNVVGRTGNTPMEHLYRGERLDPASRLYYLRARWMDPAVGRFTQMDDFAGLDNDPPSLHKYLYASNDPVSRIDPSGHASLADTTAGANVQGILNTFGKIIGAGSGILIGARINNIVQSRAAARTCAAKYSATLTSWSSGDCPDVRMPIVFMSDVVMPGIGQHVQMSQAMGSPAILNRSAFLKYANRALNLTKCVMGLAMVTAAGGTSCDEYPFASTYQGGLGATVAKVPWTSNLAQGGVLSSFYTACMVQPDIYTLSEFLVIPVLQTTAGNFQCRFFGGR
jgi:RHS repeat-associated protein